MRCFVVKRQMQHACARGCDVVRLGVRTNQVMRAVRIPIVHFKQERPAYTHIHTHTRTQTATERERERVRERERGAHTHAS